MHLIFLIPWKLQFSLNFILIDDFHNNCYRIILEVANKIIIIKTKPRTAAFQLHVPSEPVFDYFKMAATVPQLNNLLTQLNARSNIASAMVYGGLIIWKQKFIHFEEFYECYFSCYKALEAELDLWEAYSLNDISCHPVNISSTLKVIDFNSLSNIKACLRILETLPVAIFSSMRRLKTYTRSTMISEILN